MKLVVLALAVLAGGASQARAQSSCTSLPAFYFNSSNETFYYNYNVVAGDRLQFTEIVTGSYTLTVTPPGSSSATTVNYNGGSYTVPTTGTLQFAFTDGPNPTMTGLVEVTCNPPQTTWTVNTTSDDVMGVAANCASGSNASCTLRDALAAAAASTSTGLVVNFSPTVFPASNTVAQNTITITTGGTLSIPNNTTIQGLTTGSGASLTNLVTVSGGGVVGVFSVASGVTATINNLTITGGEGGFGGGIDNGGTLTVNQSTIAGNTANYSGGGIYSSGNLTITGSTLSANNANFYDLGYHGGGIYQGSGTLTISNSTLTGNSAEQSLANGGAIYVASGSSASLTGVTVTGNSASSGGGIYNGGGTLSLSNTLMFANSATAATQILMEPTPAAATSTPGRAARLLLLRRHWVLPRWGSTAARRRRCLRIRRARHSATVVL